MDESQRSQVVENPALTTSDLKQCAEFLTLSHRHGTDQLAVGLRNSGPVRSLSPLTHEQLPMSAHTV